MKDEPLIIGCGVNEHLNLLNIPDIGRGITIEIMHPMEYVQPDIIKDTGLEILYEAVQKASLDPFRGSLRNQRRQHRITKRPKKIKLSVPKIEPCNSHK